MDDLSNAAAEAVGSRSQGRCALPHAYGRLQFGADLELHFRTLIGTGANPNVAAVVVIGIEPNWTARLADGIAATGKPVDAFAIEGNRRPAHHRRAARVPPSSCRTPPSSGASRSSAASIMSQHQVRRVRHHHRARVMPDRRRRSSTAGSTPAAPCSSARPAS